MIMRVLMAILMMVVVGGDTYAVQLRFAKKVFVPDKNQISLSGTIFNESDTLYAGELSIYPIAYNEMGNEVLLEDTGENFIVYPENIVLKPKTSQPVQINYVGEDFPDNTQIFALLLEQVKINGLKSVSKLDNKEGKDISVELTFYMNYKTIMYVAPGSVESTATLASQKIITDPETKESFIEMVVKNDGNGLARVESMAVRIREATNLSKTEVIQHTSVFLVPPKSSRIVKVPYKSELAFDNPEFSIEDLNHQTI